MRKSRFSEDDMESLIQGGATVFGPRPERTGSLEDYPNRDGGIAELAGRISGDCDGVAVKEHRYGKGRVVWNRPVAALYREDTERA
jgi:hypothetical protein